MNNFFSFISGFFREKDGKPSSRRLFAISFDTVFLIIWAVVSLEKIDIIAPKFQVIALILLVNGLASFTQIMNLLEKIQELKFKKFTKIDE